MSNAFLSINNREIKSESGFSFAMASQPLRTILHKLLSLHHLAAMIRKIVDIFDVSKVFSKGWLASAKLRPLSLFISLLLMLKEAFDNARIEK